MLNILPRKEGEAKTNTCKEEANNWSTNDAQVKPSEAELKLVGASETPTEICCSLAGPFPARLLWSIVTVPIKALVSKVNMSTLGRLRVHSVCASSCNPVFTLHGRATREETCPVLTSQEYTGMQYSGRSATPANEEKPPSKSILIE